MAKKVSDSQVAGIKAHAEAKNKATIDKVNKAIDKLKRKGKPINFETVYKEAGVSRATLYNNPQLKERILSLRAISKASPLDDVVAVKKDKLQLKDDKISALREQIKKLEDDKKKGVLPFFCGQYTFYVKCSSFIRKSVLHPPGSASVS